MKFPWREWKHLLILQNWFWCRRRTPAWYMMTSERNIFNHDCHMWNIRYTAVMLNGHAILLTSGQNTINCNMYLTCYFCVSSNDKYTIQISHICHICKLVYVHIWHSSVSIYAYELTAVNNVNSSTVLHTFYIIGICPLNNKPATCIHICPTALLL